MRFNDDVAATGQYFERDRNVFLRQQTLRPFRPFDQADVLAIEFLAESGGFPFLRIAEPVQVKVAQV